MARSGFFPGAIMASPGAADNPGSADRNHHLGRAPDRPDAIAAREFDCGQIVAARPAAPRCPPSDEHEVTDLRPIEGTLVGRSEEHTSELQSLMRISYAVFCLKKKKKIQHIYYQTTK